MEDRCTQHLLASLLSFQRSGLFCDTALVTSERIVFVHSCVLAAFCPNLQEALNQRPFVNSRPNVIDLSHYDASLINALVNFMYTGVIDLDTWAQLEELCDQLGVDVPLKGEEPVSVHDILSNCELDVVEDEGSISIVKALIASALPTTETETAVVEVDTDFYDANPVLQSMENQQLTRQYSRDLDVVSIVSSAQRDSDNGAEVKLSAAASVSGIQPSRANTRSASRIERDGIWDNTGNFPCSVCGGKFMSSTTLAAHKCWRKRASYQCNVCHQVFTQKCYLQEHKRDSDTYTCYHCEQNFCTPSQLQEHMKVHDVSQDSDVQPVGSQTDENSSKSKNQKSINSDGDDGSECLTAETEEAVPKVERDVAAENFESSEVEQPEDDGGDVRKTKSKRSKKSCREEEEEFIGETMDDNLVSAEGAADTSENGETSSADVMLHCVDDGGTPAGESGPQRRRRRRKLKLEDIKTEDASSDGAAPSTGDATVTGEGGAKRRGRKSNTDPIRCNLCGLHFRWNSQLRDHMNMHEGIRPYICEICGTDFSDIDKMRKHRASAHRAAGPWKNFKCHICGHAFRTSDRLQNHLNSHSGAKPNMCDICGASFGDRGYLWKHRRLHSLARPYVCPVCDKSFAQHKNKVAHMRTHSGEKPYVCTICHAKFTQSHSLITHTRLHTNERPYACDQCPQKFIRATKLKMHILSAHVADVDKPFRCDVCNKGFPSNFHLRQHVRSHTKPHICSGCNHRFAQGSKLKKHQKSCLR